MAMDFESDLVRLKWRQAQVDIGKGTPEYQKYEEHVIYNDMRRVTPCEPPDIYQKVSKKVFGHKLNFWRRSLHSFCQKHGLKDNQKKSAISAGVVLYGLENIPPKDPHPNKQPTSRPGQFSTAASQKGFNDRPLMGQAVTNTGVRGHTTAQPAAPVDGSGVSEGPGRGVGSVVLPASSMPTTPPACTPGRQVHTIHVECDATDPSPCSRAATPQGESGSSKRVISQDCNYKQNSNIEDAMGQIHQTGVKDAKPVASGSLGSSRGVHHARVGASASVDCPRAPTGGVQDASCAEPRVGNKRVRTAEDVRTATDQLQRRRIEPGSHDRPRRCVPPQRSLNEWCASAPTSGQGASHKDMDALKQPMSLPAGFGRPQGRRYQQHGRQSVQNKFNGQKRWKKSHVSRLAQVLGNHSVAGIQQIVRRVLEKRGTKGQAAATEQCAANPVSSDSARLQGGTDPVLRLPMVTQPILSGQQCADLPPGLTPGQATPAQANVTVNERWQDAHHSVQHPLGSPRSTHPRSTMDSHCALDGCPIVDRSRLRAPDSGGSTQSQGVATLEVDESQDTDLGPQEATDMLSEALKKVPQWVLGAPLDGSDLDELEDQFIEELLEGGDDLLSILA